MSDQLDEKMGKWLDELPKKAISGSEGRKFLCEAYELELRRLNRDKYLDDKQTGVLVSLVDAVGKDSNPASAFIVLAGSTLGSILSMTQFLSKEDKTRGDAENLYVCMRLIPILCTIMVHVIDEIEGEAIKARTTSKGGSA